MTIIATAPLLRLRAVVAVGVLVVAGCQSAAPSPQRSSPAASGSARTLLAELTVAPRGSTAGYERDKFEHWADMPAPDGCDVRDAVLKRAGRTLTIGEDYDITAGTWTSPYDSHVWHDPSDLDIDHVVPLANVWASGAASWRARRRAAFANDLQRPQLVAVTDNVNQAKDDSGPAEWQPPRAGYRCRYARNWIAVKHHYQLTVTRREKAALAHMLNRC